MGWDFRSPLPHQRNQCQRKMSDRCLVVLLLLASPRGRVPAVAAAKRGNDQRALGGQLIGGCRPSRRLLPGDGVSAPLRATRVRNPQSGGVARGGASPVSTTPCNCAEFAWQDQRDLGTVACSDGLVQERAEGRSRSERGNKVADPGLLEEAARVSHEACRDGPLRRRRGGRPRSSPALMSLTSPRLRLTLHDSLRLREPDGGQE